MKSIWMYPLLRDWRGRLVEPLPQAIDPSDEWGVGDGPLPSDVAQPKSHYANREEEQADRQAGMERQLSAW